MFHHPRISHFCFQLLFISLMTAGFPAVGLLGQSPDFLPPMKVELNNELGRGVQRTMKRIEESTPAHRNTVRILFYGQSITEQAWAKMVADDLRKRYPDANLVIENRAIGGFSSQRLVMTSESDLYPFYPDLLVFYDYGSHDRYEDMIRRTRERTTSEIVLQTDHATSMAALDEETDPAKLTQKTWSSWFPNAFIPSIAAKYHTGMVEQRALWKIYARDRKIDPRSLTVDGAHLNDDGNRLMAALVGAYLVRRPQYDDPAVERQIRDYLPGRDFSWKENKLTFKFTGNRIDVIAEPGATGMAQVLIDGKKPSDIPALYVPGRVSGYPGIGWPVISHVGHEKPLLIESWTASATDFSPDGKQFNFTVEGSVTGRDGAGTSDKRFVSNSGRAIIEPEAWNIDYSFGLMKGAWARKKDKPPFVIPEKVVATWKVNPFFVDEIRVPSIADPATETLVTLALGLSNGPHELQLTGNGVPVKIRALRVYQPPLQSTGKSEDAGSKPAVRDVPQSAPPMQKTGAENPT